MIISVMVASFPKMVILTIIHRGPLKKQVKIGSAPGPWSLVFLT